MIRLSGVRTVRAMPDRVEIHTDGPEPYLIQKGVRQVTILSKGLTRGRNHRNAVATFLYFPDGPGATVLLEERSGRYTLVVEAVPSSSSTADRLA